MRVATINSRKARAISTEDRKRLRYALRRIADHDFEAIRTAAITMLAWGSGLRLSECVALDIRQVEAGRRNTINERVSLTGQQVKGGLEKGAAVEITIPSDARGALRRYLIEARARDWLSFQAFFVARRCNGHPGHHPRLAKRSAQGSWYRLQERAGISSLYRFQDLRHDSITTFAGACNGDVYQVAKFARHKNITTTLLYVHSTMNDVAETAELAERGRFR